jgi:hypothetical protein
MKLGTRDLLIRVALSVAAGFTLALIISEGSYLLTKDHLDRAPQTIELVIPNGTAAQVAAGKAVPSLPADMSFVQGDTLVVKNEDITSHQLGPIWVPAGTKGTLVMDTANQFSYECSFEPSRYLGVNIQPQVTWGTRVTAMMTLGLPTIGMFLVYSFVVFPQKPKLQANQEKMN